MLFPIKIKNKLDKEYIFKNLKSTNNKIRLNALNKIRVGNVFKTTNSSRIKLTTSFLQSKKILFNNIFDIGCSDGTASIEIIKNLNYKNYYCLDKYLKFKIIKKNSLYYLTDDQNNVLMCENKYLYFYIDKYNLNKSPIEKIFSFFFPDKIYGNYEEEVITINPEIYKYQNINFKNFDVFNQSMNTKADLIIFFNLLDKFNTEKSKNLIRDFIKKYINNNGLIIIGENNKIEKSTIYKYSDRIEILKKINNGSIIEL